MSFVFIFILGFWGLFFLAPKNRTKYSFDLMGNRIKAVSPENETFKYAYDKLYRLIELDSGKVSEKTSYSYDALGRIIEEKRTDSTTSNSFDAAGQLLEMRHSRNSSPAEIIASRKYLYDLAGNRISMTDETNKVTSYAYDNSNWLTQAVYSNNDTVSYTYNGAGDRLTEKLNNDAAINFAYDAAGRIVAKGDEAFEYDDDGNLLRDNEAFYTWNSDNRLIVVEKTLEGCRHDKYNGYGYGHLKHGKTIVAYEEYSYLPQDWRRTERKLTRYVPQNNGKGNDNTTKEESTFISIYDGNDESHEYLLSAVTDKKNNLAQTELKLVREFVNGPGTDDIAFTRYGLTSLTMLKDGLGSIIALSGPEAQIIARVGYDAWGEFRWSGDEEKAPCALNGVGPYLEQMQNTRNFGKTAHNSWNFGRHFASELSPYLYTGRRFSDFTGQYFNRHRYYSPALGRFTSKDPIGFNGGMNLYRYADNNPMLFVDPWGLFEYLGTNWIFDIAKAKQAKIEDLEAGQSWDITKWYGKKVINANARGYARPSINIKKDVDSNCKIKIQTEMGITIYLPNIGEVAGSGVTDEKLLKTIAEHEIGHEMMYRLIGERIFESLESIVNGKNLSSEEIDSKIKEAKSEFHDAIVEVDRNYHSGNPSRPFFEIDWSGFQK